MGCREGNVLGSGELCRSFRTQIQSTRSSARHMGVTQYYSLLSELWQELDMFDTLVWKCADDGLQYRKTVEKERAFDFLAGLNKSLEDVRGHLISQKPFPSIRLIFADVRREESRRRVMVGDSGRQNNTPVEPLALAVKNPDNAGNQRLEGKQWCVYCRLTNHTRENYWKLHGRPPNWRSNRQSERAPQTAAAVENPQNSRVDLAGFNKYHIEQWWKLFNQSQNTSSDIPS